VATAAGYSKANKRLRKLRANLDGVVPAIRRDLRQTREEIQVHMPVKTGFMRNNTVDRAIPGGAEVHSPAFYTGFVEFGTRYITPRLFWRPSMYASIGRLVKAIIRVVKS